MNSFIEVLIVSILFYIVLPFTESSSYEDPYLGALEILEMGWIDNESDNLYHLDNRPTTWYQAVENCKKKGKNGRLATIDTESSLISLRLNAKGLHVTGNYWIGIHKHVSGVFERLGSVQSSYFNWAPKEPTNSENEKCVELRMYSLEFNDIACDIKNPFICVSDQENGTAFVSSKSTPSLTVTDSATDWIDIGSNTLYSIEYSLATWNESFEKCKLKGINGRLATVDSRLITNRLKTYVKDAGLLLWIGIRKDSSGSFINIGNKQNSYFNWDAGEPNDLGDEDCVELLNWSMKWNDLPCDVKRFYLCASDKEPSFPTISSTSMKTSSNSAVVLHASVSSMSAPLLTLTDIAKGCHAILIATTFLIVFVCLVILVALILIRWPITPKVVSADTESLL